jgi:hypothetical protein
MTAEAFQAALERASELEVTTTGRVSGRPSSRPVWFVRQDGSLYLLPSGGSGTQWYKNMLKTPVLDLAASGVRLQASGVALTEPAAVARVVESFRAKYGAREVAGWYRHPDVAVEIPLG